VIVPTRTILKNKTLSARIDDVCSRHEPIPIHGSTKSRRHRNDYEIRDTKFRVHDPADHHHQRQQPAIIHVGDSYADLGATVTDTAAGQAGDNNLGIKTFLNGALVSNIVIDTTQIATDTIDYVAADQNGLTATTTRTVLILPAPTTVIAPSTPFTSPSATTTVSDATSTSL
jgi:hypothetical protein